MGVASGIAAIWLACDKVGEMLSAAKSNNIGTTESAVLLAGMFVFAKSVDSWRAWASQQGARVALAADGAK